MHSPKIELDKKPVIIRRAAIEGVEPEIDAGRYPIKRTVGENVVVQADVFVDGHDVLSAVVLYRPDSEDKWREAPMRFVDNDRWQGQFRRIVFLHSLSPLVLDVMEALVMGDADQPASERSRLTQLC